MERDLLVSEYVSLFNISFFMLILLPNVFQLLGLCWSQHVAKWRSFFFKFYTTPQWMLEGVQSSYFWCLCLVFMPVDSALTSVCLKLNQTAHTLKCFVERKLISPRVVDVATDAYFAVCVCMCVCICMYVYVHTNICLWVVIDHQLLFILFIVCELIGLAYMLRMELINSTSRGTDCILACLYICMTICTSAAETVQQLHQRHRGSPVSPVTDRPHPHPHPRRNPHFTDSHTYRRLLV
jgi:hypothetical protein